MKHFCKKLVLCLFAMQAVQGFSQTQEADSIAVSAIANNFFRWYISQSYIKIDGEVNPKFVKSSNGMTTLDFEPYISNLKKYGFSDSLVELEKASYATCLQNLARVPYPDFLRFDDLDDFESRGCDFTNYYRWTGGQEIMTDYAVKRVESDQNQAAVYGILYNAPLQPGNYRQHIVVRLQKQADAWKIIGIDQ